MNTYLLVSMSSQPQNLFPKCPIRTTMELLGGKWKLLVISKLAGRPLRYSELRQAVPEISEKMLAQVLRELAVDGLIARQQGVGNHTQSSYLLTEKGLMALPLIEKMVEFAREYTELDR
jgi:DNA-binding HxlR family transcriptional regulator